MIHGLDTGFLAAAEIKEHSQHNAARLKIAHLIAAGDQIAIAPQVLAEFIHIATDSRRFAQSLNIAVARQLAGSHCRLHIHEIVWRAGRPIERNPISHFSGQRQSARPSIHEACHSTAFRIVHKWKL